MCTSADAATNQIVSYFICKQSSWRTLLAEALLYTQKMGCSSALLLLVTCGTTGTVVEWYKYESSRVANFSLPARAELNAAAAFVSRKLASIFALVDAKVSKIQGCKVLSA